MGVIRQICEILDNAWEDLIYDPASDLPTLWEVDNIDARWLPYLKPLLAFTDDLPFTASETELRRILRDAVPYWNKKPTEEAVVLFAIRMVTGNRFRARNFFDLRMQEGETCLVEELQDFDPHVLGFPTEKFFGDEVRLNEYTLDGEFTLDDLDESLPGGFRDAHQFAWLILENSTKTPSNDGIYPIDSLITGSNVGHVVFPFPNPPASDDLTWRLLGYAGEYTTEVRVVDQAVGTLSVRDVTGTFTAGEWVYGDDSKAKAYIDSLEGNVLSLIKIRGRFQANEGLTSASATGYAQSKLAGVLNRDLLRFLMGDQTVKPFSERLDVVYISFLDQFLTPDDLDQWNHTGLVSVPSPGGTCLVEEDGLLWDADPYSATWDDQIVAWKVTVPEADFDAKYECRFMQDETTPTDDHYFVQVSYDPKQVALYRRDSGTPTIIGSAVAVPYLKAGVAEVIRVDALAEGSDTRIRVKLSGETLIDVKETTAQRHSGGVGFTSVTKNAQVTLIEVNALPTDVDRVGPNP